MDILLILYMLFLCPYTYVFIGFVIGLILTIRKPKPWKYYTLLGSQCFLTLCFCLRLAWIESQTWGKFGAPNDELWITMTLPLFLIALIVTAMVCISTRKKWNIPEDKPGFCSDMTV